MYKIRKDHFFIVFWAILLGTSGLKWIPILNIGSIKVEIHNAVVLILDGFLIYFCFTRKKLRLPYFLWCLAALTVWLSASLALHGTINLSPIILTLPVVLASVVICNVRVDSIDNLPAIALLAQFFILLAFIVSAIASGTDLLGGTLEYFTTLNRNGFVLGPVRSMFNAFSSGQIVNNVPEYDGWLLNHLSASLYITFVLAVAAQPQRKWQGYMLKLSAGFSFILIFTLFSSTVLMALVYALSILCVRFILRPNKPWIFWTFLSVASWLVLFLMPPVLEYLTLNASADGGSASSRMVQYKGAIEGIMENPILGVGMRTFDTHTVHNLFLGSFMMTGVVGGLLALLVFVAAGALMLEGLVRFTTGSAYPSLCLVMAMAPAIFLTRAGFSGGFGLPSNAELFAVSIAYLCKLRLKQLEAEPMPQALVFDVPNVQT